LRMRGWQNYVFFEGHGSPASKGGGH
jgi:hypothetical protein